MKQINIAIDGPSASGKSTVAKLVCGKLGYKHLDTGAMYRCVGLKVKQEKVDMNNEAQLSALLDRIKIELTSEGQVFLDGKDVTKAIRENDISMLASDVSTKEIVRTKLVAIQQDIAAEKGYIMDGRDIGTVVLPDAELKIYLTASVDTRAKRRYLENQQKGIESNLLTLVNEIVERDYQDTHRKISPLKQAKDAILIDSSEMTLDEVVGKVMELVEEKIKE